MPKYDIYSNDDKVGTLILKREQPDHFESVAFAPGLSDHPLILYFGLMLGTAGFANVVGFNSMLAGGVGVTIASVLTGIKAWRGSILPEGESLSTGIKIDAEFTDLNTNTIYRDTIENPNINPDAFISMCKLLKANNFFWVGRLPARIKGRIGRTQHSMIRSEFERNKYFNGNRINQRGRHIIYRFV